MKAKIVFTMILVLVALALVNTPLWAQTKNADEARPEDKVKKPAMEEGHEELAKAAQNPVADMVSIPIQSNFNFDYGADRDKSQIVTNI